MTTPVSTSRRDEVGQAPAAVELRDVSRHCGDRHAPVRGPEAVPRGREFAVARVAGMHRAQVVWLAVLESWVVAATGMVLGGLAAAGTIAGVAAATANVTGQAFVVVPWPVLGAVVAGGLVVVGGSSVLTALAVTRPRPVTLTAARE